MLPPLLDTDALSEILKGRNEHVGLLAVEYLRKHGTYHFSLITRFEILRGLHAKEATTQLERFEILCEESIVFPLSDKAVVRAARIWADLRRQGTPIGQADLLIGSTALAEGRAVATRNTQHFRLIPDLEVLDWRAAEE